MRLGILSDNHGRLEPVRAALALFEQQEVEGVVHCGDVGGMETLELLASKPFWFVWGNMDSPESSWRPLVKALGGNWPGRVPVVISQDGRTIAVCHGHEAVFERVCRCGEYDFVLHGHTHQRADHRHGRTRIVNPGALHRTAVKTVAILDAKSDALEFFEIGSTR